MTYDPNDPNRNPTTDHDLRTPPLRRSSSSWIGWIAAIAVILVAAFAITEWFDRPGTDPNPTASTTESPADEAAGSPNGAVQRTGNTCPGQPLQPAARHSSKRAAKRSLTSWRRRLPYLFDAP